MYGHAPFFFNVCNSKIDGFKGSLVFVELNFLSGPKIARIDQIKEELKPFVEDQKIKTEIDALEKLVNEDIQKLNLIKQTALEIENSEKALAGEKTKLFSHPSKTVKKVSCVYFPAYNAYIRLQVK